MREQRFVAHSHWIVAVRRSQGKDSVARAGHFSQRRPQPWDSRDALSHTNLQEASVTFVVSMSQQKRCIYNSRCSLTPCWSTTTDLGRFLTQASPVTLCVLISDESVVKCIWRKCEFLYLVRTVIIYLLNKCSSESQAISCVWQRRPGNSQEERNIIPTNASVSRQNWMRAKHAWGLWLLCAGLRTRPASRQLYAASEWRFSKAKHCCNAGNSSAPWKMNTS